MERHHKLALGAGALLAIDFASRFYSEALVAVLGEAHLLPAVLAASGLALGGAAVGTAFYRCIKGVDAWSVYPPETTHLAPKIFSSIDPVETALLEAEGVTGTAAEHHKVALPYGEFYDLAGAVRLRQAAKKRRS